MRGIVEPSSTQRLGRPEAAELSPLGDPAAHATWPGTRDLAGTPFGD